MKVFSLVKLVFLSIGHCIERVLCNILNVLCDVYINISLNTSSSIVTPNIRSRNLSCEVYLFFTQIWMTKYMVVLYLVLRGHSSITLHIFWQILSPLSSFNAPNKLRHILSSLLPITKNSCRVFFLLSDLMAHILSLQIPNCGHIYLNSLFYRFMSWTTFELQYCSVAEW